MYDFFYPEYSLKIGNNTVKEGVTLEALLDKDAKFDWCEVTFTDKLKGAITVNSMDEVSLKLGYNGALEEVFTGYVTNQEDRLIVAKNEMVKVAQTMITNSFVSCIPQEVVTFILEKAGVTDYKLSQTPYPIKKLINISKMNGLEALKEVDKAFNINPSIYIFKCKGFEWNLEDAQSKVYDFIYAENIIELECISDKTWELSTISVPFVKILDKINVTHPKVSGTFKVNKIKISINESGFIRTKLIFKEGEDA